MSMTKRHADFSDNELPQKRSKGPDKQTMTVSNPEATLDSVVSLLHASRNILVLTGAGISVSCGIPDFRSENGIYNMVCDMDLGLPDPESLFDKEFFLDDPLPLYKFLRTLSPAGNSPSVTHRFIRRIEEQKKLLRNYTQNVDALEQSAGINKAVFCHGSLATGSCSKCSKTKHIPFRDKIFSSSIPLCSFCSEALRPDIIFFGEKLPGRVNKLITSDRDKADLLVCIGTSLSVAPVSGFLDFLPADVPRILINQTVPKKYGSSFHYQLLGDCDVITTYLSARLGWSNTPQQPSAPAEAPLSISMVEAGVVLFDHHTDRRSRDSEGQGKQRLQLTAAKPNSQVFDDSADSNDKNDISAEDTFLYHCDRCSDDIQDVRYSCDKCFDYDLCSKCFLGLKAAKRKWHCSTHVFKKINFKE